MNPKIQRLSAKSDEVCTKNTKGIIKNYLNTENSICLDRNYFWIDFVNNRLVFSFHINI